jgi:hypothetical protein
MFDDSSHIVVELPSDLNTSWPVVRVGNGCAPTLGKPVVSVSNIKYISLTPTLSKGEGVETKKVLTVYLSGFKHFKISKNHKK